MSIFSEEAVKQMNEGSMPFLKIGDGEMAPVTLVGKAVIGKTRFINGAGRVYDKNGAFCFVVNAYNHKEKEMQIFSNGKMIAKQLEEIANKYGDEVVARSAINVLAIGEGKSKRYSAKYSRELTSAELADVKSAVPFNLNEIKWVKEMLEAKGQGDGASSYTHVPNSPDEASDRVPF